MADLLPLFPLEVVLFPGTPLPLHIFEPRYKEMIGECLERKQPFGVLRAVDKETLAEVGCTAEIVEVVKQYDDGRLDILAEGRQRFEVVQIEQGRSFLRGDVRFFDDEPGEPPREKTSRALELFDELVSLAGEEGPEHEIEHPQLSFQLVAPLPLDLDFKQALLAMRSEPKRIQAVVDYYEKLLPRMKLAMKAQKKAGGNGHVV